MRDAKERRAEAVAVRSALRRSLVSDALRFRPTGASPRRSSYGDTLISIFPCGEKRQDLPAPHLRRACGARPLSVSPEGERPEGAHKGRPYGRGLDWRLRGNDGAGFVGFENRWWLRDGPSSQSSPLGRRGKTSRPHTSDAPGGACPLSFSPRGGEVQGAPPEGERPEETTRLRDKVRATSPWRR